jgi:hypothetical protein
MRRVSWVSSAHPPRDNLIRGNSIKASGKVGILFRDETQAFGPHRNRCEHNQIFDSGPDDGVGIDVRGHTEAVSITHNEVRETRGTKSRVGIRIGPETRDINLAANEIVGYPIEVSDLHSPG